MDLLLLLRVSCLIHVVEIIFISRRKRTYTAARPEGLILDMSRLGVLAATVYGQQRKDHEQRQKERNTRTLAGHFFPFQIRVLSLLLLVNGNAFTPVHQVIKAVAKRLSIVLFLQFPNVLHARLSCPIRNETLPARRGRMVPFTCICKVKIDQKLLQ